MGVPKFSLQEEEFREWLYYIAVICLNEDFQSLKKELEALYKKHGVDEAELAAFQDALYAFLVQREND